MKDLTLPDLIKTLSTPEKQPMDVLMSACKQAAQFIKNEQIIWKKGAEFAKLFSGAPISEDTEPNKPAYQGVSSEEATEIPDKKPEVAELEHVKGAYNIYITGVRPIKGGMRDRVEILKAIREASGELNAAPRMTLQKANELLADLELGDRATLLRVTNLPDEAKELIQSLSAVGVLAELR